MFDGGITKIYVNGILSNTEDYSAKTIKNTTDGTIGIGYFADISIEFLFGSMQNLRFYNRALTAGEASKLHRLKL